MRFTRSGELKNVFSFDDRLPFGSRTYGPPWGITDFRVRSTGRGYRIALAAHHLEWWPSIVTILDESSKRLGTFINAGWVERVHWISDERLVIAGFSNDQDGGMGYWDMHRQLEALGKITHTREQCPDRDGPRQILVWEPETGWITTPTAPTRGRNHL
jgi:hypothetical protein